MTAAVSPAPSLPSTQVSPLRIAAVAGGAVAFANVAFFALSTLYFSGHVKFVEGVGDVPAYDAAGRLDVRLAFALFTSTVGIATMLAGLWPRAIGHAIAVLMGAGSFVAGCVAAYRGLPGALIGAELSLGVLMPLLAVLSWRNARAAWSFLISMSAVYAIVLFFGAPTVHRVLGTGLWVSLILPGLNIVAFVSLIQIRARYRE